MRIAGHLRNTQFLTNLGSDVEWLREHLKSRGVHLSTRIPLGRALNRLELFASGSYKDVPLKQVPKHFRRSGSYDILLDVYGADVLTRILRRAEPRLDGSFDRHWQALTDGDALPLRTGASSGGRNRSWELFVGALCTEFADDVRAAEPDIACTFMQTRVGIACKCLYSTDQANNMKRLVEGAKQIESSDVTCGFVLANVTNLLDHRALLDPKKVTEADKLDPVRAVYRSAENLFLRLPLDDLAGRLEEGPSGPRHKTRGILFFAAALVPANGFGITLASPIAGFFFRRIHTDSDSLFVDRLRRALFV